MTIISETPTPLLVVDDLAVEFATSSGAIHAVNGISFTVAAGETVGVELERAAAMGGDQPVKERK